jgi:hypothetical protein
MTVPYMLRGFVFVGVLVATACGGPGVVVGRYAGTGTWANEVGEFPVQVALALARDGDDVAGSIDATGDRVGSSAQIRIVAIGADDELSRVYSDCTYAGDDADAYGCPFEDTGAWTVDRWFWHEPDAIEIARGDADTEANQIIATVRRIDE